MQNPLLSSFKNARARSSIKWMAVVWGWWLGGGGVRVFRVRWGIIYNFVNHVIETKRLVTALITLCEHARLYQFRNLLNINQSEQ